MRSCLYPNCIEKVQYKRIVYIPPMVTWFSHIPWDVLIMHLARAIGQILFLKWYATNSILDHVMFFSGSHDLVMKLDTLILDIYIRSPECKITDILHALVSWTHHFHGCLSTYISGHLHVALQNDKPHSATMWWLWFYELLTIYFVLFK
jgi:hypothetical protein